MTTYKSTPEPRSLPRAEKALLRRMQEHLSRQGDTQNGLITNLSTTVIQGGSALPDGTQVGDMLVWNGSAWVFGNHVDAAGNDLEWYDGSGTGITALRVDTTTGRVLYGSPAQSTYSGQTILTSLTLENWISFKTATAAASASFGGTETYIGVTTSGITITLPSAANIMDGHILFVKDETGTGTSTVEGFSGQLIDGINSHTLNVYECMMLMARNGAWWII